MNNLQKRLHRALGSMIGNESLFESLDDEAVGELFAWGEAITKRIVEETDGMDDDAAEEYLAPRLRALRMMMRALSRWAGEADALDDESRSTLWMRAGEQARIVFGESFAPPAMEEALAQLSPEASAKERIGFLKETWKG